MINKFKQTVEALGLQFFSGIQALNSSEHNFITIKKPKNLRGSVNIDEDLKNQYPNAARWDYAVAYTCNNQALLFFIEIHPVNGQSLNSVTAKKEWLDSWLNGKGKALLSYVSSLKVTYYWIATSHVPPKDNPIYKKVAKLGVIGPKSFIIIPK